MNCKDPKQNLKRERVMLKKEEKTLEMAILDPLAHQSKKWDRKTKAGIGVRGCLLVRVASGLKFHGGKGILLPPQSLSMEKLS